MCFNCLGFCFVLFQKIGSIEFLQCAFLCSILPYILLFFFFSELSLNECRRKKSTKSVNMKQMLKDVLKISFLFHLQLYLYTSIYSLREKLIKS